MENGSVLIGKEYSLYATYKTLYTRFPGPLSMFLNPRFVPVQRETKKNNKILQNQWAKTKKIFQYLNCSHFFLLYDRNLNRRPFSLKNI